ncbi:hypothetical protein D9601_03060 [Sphingomonas sp. MA1305]|nr:hypothetical protein [Sphingomonas sp. MA1305]
MRWLVIGLACGLLAGCSKAPDGPGEATARAGTLAFAYQFTFRLPSARIADAQEAAAQACERLGAGCRITGMTYRVDDAARVSASLDLRVASSGARAFGRRSVQQVEQAGGVLAQAEISGTDPTDAKAQAADAADTTDAETQLAGRTPAASVVPLNVATTPIRFTYVAGAGVGLRARLGEAAAAGYASLNWTLGNALTLLAYGIPPFVLLFLVALFWHRVGRPLHRRLFPPPAG